MSYRYVSERDAKLEADRVRGMMRCPDLWYAKVDRSPGGNYWLWRLICGPVSLFESGGCGEYYSMVAKCSDHAGSGYGIWTDSGGRRSRDPQKAVDYAVDLAAAKVEELADTVDEASRACFGLYTAILQRRNGTAEVGTTEVVEVSGINGVEAVRAAYDLLDGRGSVITVFKGRPEEVGVDL